MRKENAFCVKKQKRRGISEEHAASCNEMGTAVTELARHVLQGYINQVPCPTCSKCCAAAGWRISLSV